MDLSAISEMVEPSVKSALDGYKRKLREKDDEIESIQYYLTRAAPLGSESEMVLDYKSQLQKAVEDRGNCVMATRLLQDRLMDLAVSAAEAERAAAAGAALLSPGKGFVEAGGKGHAVNPLLDKVGPSVVREGASPGMAGIDEASEATRDETGTERERLAANPPLKKVGPSEVRKGAPPEMAGSSVALERARVGASSEMAGSGVAPGVAYEGAPPEMAGSGAGAPVEARDEPECEGQDHAADLALEESEPVLARGYEEARTSVAGSAGGPLGPDGKDVVADESAGNCCPYAKVGDWACHCGECPTWEPLRTESGNFAPTHPASPHGGYVIIQESALSGFARHTDVDLPDVAFDKSKRFKRRERLVVRAIKGQWDGARAHRELLEELGHPHHVNEQYPLEARSAPVAGSAGGPFGPDGEVDGYEEARTSVAGSAGGPCGPDGGVVYDGSPEGNPLGGLDPVAVSVDGVDVLSDASDPHGVGRAIVGSVRAVDAHPPNSLLTPSAGEAVPALAGQLRELADESGPDDECLMVEGCGMVCTTDLGCQARERFQRAQVPRYEDVSMSLVRGDDERLPIWSPDDDAVALLQQDTELLAEGMAGLQVLSSEDGSVSRTPQGRGQQASRAPRTPVSEETQARAGEFFQRLSPKSRAAMTQAISEPGRRVLMRRLSERRAAAGAGSDARASKKAELGAKRLLTMRRLAASEQADRRAQKDAAATNAAKGHRRLELSAQQARDDNKMKAGYRDGGLPRSEPVRRSGGVEGLADADCEQCGERFVASPCTKHSDGRVKRFCELCGTTQGAGSASGGHGSMFCRFSGGHGRLVIGWSVDNVGEWLGSLGLQEGLLAAAELDGEDLVRDDVVSGLVSGTDIDYLLARVKRTARRFPDVDKRLVLSTLIQARDAVLLSGFTPTGSGTAGVRSAEAKSPVELGPAQASRAVSSPEVVHAVPAAQEFSDDASQVCSVVTSELKTVEASGVGAEEVLVETADAAARASAAAAAAARDEAVRREEVAYRVAEAERLRQAEEYRESVRASLREAVAQGEATLGEMESEEADLQRSLRSCISEKEELLTRTATATASLLALVTQPERMAAVCADLLAFSERTAQLEDMLLTHQGALSDLGGRKANQAADIRDLRTRLSQVGAGSPARVIPSAPLPLPQGADGSQQGCHLPQQMIDAALEALVPLASESPQPGAVTRILIVVYDDAGQEPKELLMAFDTVTDEYGLLPLEAPAQFVQGQVDDDGLACADHIERVSRRQYLALLSETAVTEIVDLLTSMGLVKLSECKVPFLGHWSARHRGTDDEDGVQMDPVFLIEARHAKENVEARRASFAALNEQAVDGRRSIEHEVSTRTILLSDCGSLGSMKVNTDLTQLESVALVFRTGGRPCGLGAILGGAITADEERHLDVWNTTQAEDHPDSSTTLRLGEQFHAVAKLYGILDIDQNLHLTDKWDAAFPTASPACYKYSDFVAVVVSAIARLAVLMRYQYQSSEPSAVTMECARPRVSGTVRDYSKGLADGGHLDYKGGTDMFGSVLSEMQRILESVDVEDSSHEARALAVERRFRVSRDLVGQRSMECAEAVRQLRLLRWFDGNDGLGGELKRVGHLVAKQCYHNYALALVATEVQDRAAAAVGLLQYGRDSVLVDSLTVGRSPTACAWRRILGVERASVAQGQAFADLTDRYRSVPKLSPHTVGAKYWKRLASCYGYRVVAIPEGYLWQKPEAWATTTEYVLSYYSTALHGRSMAEYSVPDWSHAGRDGDLSVDASSVGGRGRTNRVLVDTSVGDGGATSEPVCTMPVVLTLAKGHSKPSFQLVVMPCGDEFLRVHTVSMDSLLDCSWSDWDAIVRTRHCGAVNRSNGVRLLEVVTGNKVRDAGLRSIWDSMRTKAEQSVVKLRGSSVFVVSSHPSPFLASPLQGPFGRGGDGAVLLRSCDPVDMWSLGDPDLVGCDGVRTALRDLKAKRDFSAALLSTFPLRGHDSEYDGLRVDSRPSVVLQLGVAPVPATSMSSVLLPGQSVDCGDSLAGSSRWGASFVRTVARSVTTVPAHIGDVPQLAGLGQYSHFGEDLNHADHRLLVARILFHAVTVLSLGDDDQRQPPAILRNAGLLRSAVVRNESVFWSECGLLNSFVGCSLVDSLMKCFTLRRVMASGALDLASAAWKKARFYARDKLGVPFSSMGAGMDSEVAAAALRALHGGAATAGEHAAGRAAVHAVDVEEGMRAPSYWKRAVTGPLGFQASFDTPVAPDLAGAAHALRRSAGTALDLLSYLFALADFAWVYCLEGCHRDGGSDVYGLMCSFVLPAFLPSRDFVGFCGSLGLSADSVSFPLTGEHPDNIGLRTPLFLPSPLLSGVPLMVSEADEDIGESFCGGGGHVPEWIPGQLPVAPLVGPVDPSLSGVVSGLSRTVQPSGDTRTVPPPGNPVKSPPKLSETEKRTLAAGGGLVREHVDTIRIVCLRAGVSGSVIEAADGPNLSVQAVKERLVEGWVSFRGRTYGVGRGIGPGVGWTCSNVKCARCECFGVDSPEMSVARLDARSISYPRLPAGVRAYERGDFWSFCSLQCMSKERHRRGRIAWDRRLNPDDEPDDPGTHPDGDDGDFDARTLSDGGPAHRLWDPLMQQQLGRPEVADMARLGRLEGGTAGGAVEEDAVERGAAGDGAERDTEVEEGAGVGAVPPRRPVASAPDHTPAGEGEKAVKSGSESGSLVGMSAVEEVCYICDTSGAALNTAEYAPGCAVSTAHRQGGKDGVSCKGCLQAMVATRKMQVERSSVEREAIGVDRPAARLACTCCSVVAPLSDTRLCVSSCMSVEHIRARGEVRANCPTFNGDDPQARLTDVVADDLAVEELNGVLARANVIDSESLPAVDRLKAYVALVGSMEKPPPEVYKMLCEASACEAMKSERHAPGIVDMFAGEVHRILGRLSANRKEHGERRLFGEFTATLSLERAGVTWNRHIPNLQALDLQWDKENGHDFDDCEHRHDCELCHSVGMCSRQHLDRASFMSEGEWGTRECGYCARDCARVSMSHPGISVQAYRLGRTGKPPTSSVSTSAPTCTQIEKCFPVELGGSYGGSLPVKSAAHKLENGEIIELRKIMGFGIPWAVALEDAMTSGWTFSVEDETGARRDLFASGPGEVFTLEGGGAATHTLVSVGGKKVHRLCKKASPPTSTAIVPAEGGLDKQVGNVLLRHILASEDPVADFNLTSELLELHSECKTTEASIRKDNDRRSEIMGNAATAQRKLDLRASQAGLDVKMNIYVSAAKAFAERAATAEVPYDLEAVIRSYGLRRRSVDEDGRPTRVSFAPVLSGDLRPQSLDQSRFGDISSCEASLKWALEESYSPWT